MRTRLLPALALLSACLTSHAAWAAPTMDAPPPSMDLPPYSQAYEPTTVDERGLWMEADEDERVLRDSTLLIRDEALNHYVKGVLCEAVGQDRCKSVRVYVMEVPQFNASMVPNGAMRVWSGLLLRVQNEAELAAVLGHEFAHFELRHGVTGFKKARSATDVAAVFAVLGGALNQDTSVLQAAVVGTYFRFNRAQEAEADLLSLKYMGQSPYPAIAASQIWTYIIGESDARAIGRGQKPKKEYSAGFFDTHPASLERATYLREQAEKMRPGGDFRAQRYRDAIRPFLPQLLSAQVKSGDFGGSDFLLNTMSGVEGWTGDLLYARGELYRMRAEPRDLITAAQFYREAIGKGYTNPDVHRALGLSLLRSGEQADGKAELGQYLSLKPDATDKGVIQMLVGN